jgi:bifunctional DNase/RNase
MGMEKIQLEIIGMSYSQSQSGAYALILGEMNGKRRLPIIIGGFEAQSIAIEIEKIKTPRPLTHDLFKSLATSFNIRILEVIINKFSEGVFYAVLACTNGEIEMEIDSRTSDAIALALRFQCPVYTFESIMVAAGIMIDEETEKKETSTRSASVSAQPSEEEEISFSQLSVDELHEILQSAVENEEYEKASRIRDELNKRK